MYRTLINRVKVEHFYLPEFRGIDGVTLWIALLLSLIAVIKLKRRRAGKRRGPAKPTCRAMMDLAKVVIET